MLITVKSSVTATTSDSSLMLLDGLNSGSLNSTLPTGSICNSPILASLCNTPLGSYVIKGGCTSAAGQCSPPELLSSKCVQRNSGGAYVIAVAAPTSSSAAVGGKASGKNGKAPAAGVAPVDDGNDEEDEEDYDDEETAAGARGLKTIVRPRRPKQARFVGCCVQKVASRTVYGRRTCKRIRVGKRFMQGGSRGLKTLVMDPLKQLANCQCFNVREFVRFGESSQTRREDEAGFVISRSADWSQQDKAANISSKRSVTHQLIPPTLLSISFHPQTCTATPRSARRPTLSRPTRSRCRSPPR